MFLKNSAGGRRVTAIAKAPPPAKSGLPLSRLAGLRYASISRSFLPYNRSLLTLTHKIRPTPLKTRRPQLRAAQ